MRIQRRVSEEFGAELSVVEMFDRPTIRHLAELLGRDTAAPATAAPPVDTTAPTVDTTAPPAADRRRHHERRRAARRSRPGEASAD